LYYYTAAEACNCEACSAEIWLISSRNTQQMPAVRNAKNSDYFSKIMYAMKALKVKYILFQHMLGLKNAFENNHKYYFID
jgi:hypothetical protein